MCPFCLSCVVYIQNIEDVDLDGSVEKLKSKSWRKFIFTYVKRKVFNLMRNLAAWDPHTAIQREYSDSICI